MNLKKNKNEKEFFNNIWYGFCPLKQQNAYYNPKQIILLNILNTKMMSYYIMFSNLYNGILINLYGEE